MGFGAESYKGKHSCICSDSWIFIVSGESKIYNNLIKAQISFTLKWVLAANLKKKENKKPLLLKAFCSFE